MAADPDHLPDYFGKLNRRKPLRSGRYLWAEFRLWTHLLSKTHRLFLGDIHQRIALNDHAGTRLGCSACDYQP